MKKVTSSLIKNHFFKYPLLLVTLSGFNLQAFKIPKDYKIIKSRLALIAEIKPVTDGNKFYRKPGSIVSSPMWSGYIAFDRPPVTGSVKKVSGSWIVPTVKPFGPNVFAASEAWVGIDDLLPTLEQIGTYHGSIAGKEQYFAFFQITPGSGAQLIKDFPVNPGDSITASVEFVGKQTFKMIIMNNTKKIAYTVPADKSVSPKALRNSAEWFVSRPTTTGYGSILADFDEVFWSNCCATINGVSGPINDPHWTTGPITMLNQNQIVLASASPLSSNGRGFSVAWKHR